MWSLYSLTICIESTGLNISLPYCKKYQDKKQFLGRFAVFILYDRFFSLKIRHFETS